MPKKNCLRLILGLFFLFLLTRLYYAMTDDFRLHNISYPDLPHATLTSSKEDLQLLQPIFAQRFFYLGKGAQSYAFASEDGKFVVKFFKFKHLKPNWLMQMLPSFPPFVDWKKRYLERKKRKFDSIFDGYALAYRKNKERSGLVYLQLQPNPHLALQATLIDKLGREHLVDLTNTCFLLQKKGVPLRDHLDSLLFANRLSAAKESIKALLSMYIEEYSEGIYDRDHGLLQNTGFLGQTPFHLDVGKLVEKPSMQSPDIYKQDLEWVIWKIRAWIHKHYPIHAGEMGNFLAEQYASWIHEPLPTPPANENSWKAKARHEHDAALS